MPRPHRPLLSNAVYHVYSRSRPDLQLFVEDAERRLFLNLLLRVASVHDWVCLTYCLMGTHFHLVVRTPQPNLDRGMQRLLSGFALRLNERRETRGPVFSGRYGSQLLRTDAHLAEVLRYVALNPVRAGIRDEPAAWPWSGHRALAGHDPAGFLAVREVHQLIEALNGVGGSQGYVELVRSAVGGDDIAGCRDIDATGLSTPGQPPLETVLAGGGAEQVRVAYREHGYSLRRIAIELGVHVSTVSRRLRRLEASVPVGSAERATQRV